MTSFMTKLKAAWDIFFPEQLPEATPKEEGKQRLRMILVADRCGMSPAGLAEMKVRGRRRGARACAPIHRPARAPAAPPLRRRRPAQPCAPGLAVARSARACTPPAPPSSSCQGASRREPRQPTESAPRPPPRAPAGRAAPPQPPHAPRPPQKTILRALEEYVDIECEEQIDVSINVDPSVGTVYCVAVPIRKVGWVRPRWQAARLAGGDGSAARRPLRDDRGGVGVQGGKGGRCSDGWPASAA